MINSIKKLIPLICIILLLGFSSEVNGAEIENTPLADYLNEMGLFQGTGQGYALNDVTTRAQGAVMVVRLLGKEGEALAMNYTHPFFDVPDWASPYIGYMWKYGISKGINKTTYGADKLVSATEYMTFLIRVLGYDDSMGDFSWDKSLLKANTLGIIAANEYSTYQSKSSFLRDDMVLFSYAVLKGDLKNGKGISLLRKLMDDSTVPQTAMLDYKLAPYVSAERNYQPRNQKEFKQSVMESMVAYENQLVLDISKSAISFYSMKEIFDQAMYELIELPGYYGTAQTIHYKLAGNKLIVSFDYTITKGNHDQSEEAGKKISSQIITRDMSDYERELAIHDYIVDSTSYDLNENNEIYKMYGVFIDKKAVCQGYAEAFFYLSTLAGLDAQMVVGDGISDGTSIPHAWNTVEIEGEWYQVDSTWDDPVSKDGMNNKTYKYFNITNTEMEIDHKWETGDFMIGNGTKYNYYVFNNQVVIGQEGLNIALKEGFKNRKKQMEFKVVGDKINKNQLADILNSVRSFRSCLYFVDEDKGIIQITNITY